MSVLSARSDIQLPTELLSIIINELGSDAKALASCRLASYVLCSLTTPLFFSSLALSIFQGRLERARNVDQLLSNHDVAALVHTFTLRCERRCVEDSRIGPLISTILYRLPHIRTFRFYGDGDCSSFQRDISPAIQALCKSPNLTTLELDDVHSVPITVITACPNLRFLHLSRVSFEWADVASMDETSTLQSFEVDMSTLSSLDLVIPKEESFAKYFSRIRNFQVKSIFGGYLDSLLTFGWDMILLTSQTLTTLDLSASGYGGNEIPDGIWDLFDPLQGFPFDLGRSPALRHFTVQVPAWFDDNLLVLSFLIRLLSTSSSTSGIETLKLKISWINDNDADEILDFFAFGYDWVGLDQVLTSERFVSLRRVVLHWVLQLTSDDVPSQELHNYALGRLFPNLRRRHILETPLETPRTFHEN